MPTYRKKLDRAPSTTGQLPTAKFYCCRCGTAYSRQKGYFPVSHSPMYRGSGFLPVCSVCIDEMFDQYVKELGDERAAMRRMCMKLDLYWHESIYEMMEKTAGLNSKVRNYIGKSNMVRFIDKNYDNTLKEEAKLRNGEPLDDTPPAKEKVEEKEPEPEEEIDVPDEIRAFWGSGFSDSMYLLLDERYRYWVSELPKGVVLDVGTKALLRQIVTTELEINRLKDTNQPIDKAVKTLTDLLGSALLKPSQQKEGADTELENMPLGVGIQKWEMTRPLPKTSDKLKDQSGIIKNITTWYLGHACKMVGLKNSYCKMYEDAMEKLRVKRPEYNDEDDEAFLNDIFGSQSGGDDG